MHDLREQCLKAWTDRRADETRAMLATAKDKPLPGHGWTGEGKCPLCGVTGPHDDREVSK